MSAFTQIQGRIVDAVNESVQAALEARPTLIGVNVQVNRTEAIGRDWTHAIKVRLDSSSDLGSQVLGAQDRLTVFTVDCMVRTSASVEPASQADELLGVVWSAVHDLDMQDVDVMEVKPSPQIDWDYVSADGPVVAATFRLEVSHRLKISSLEPWSAV